MELFFTASLLAAFIAGIAALFAPCYISALLPSYFASIFREKKEDFFNDLHFLFRNFIGFFTHWFGSSRSRKVFQPLS